MYSITLDLQTYPNLANNKKYNIEFQIYTVYKTLKSNAHGNMLVKFRVKTNEILAKNINPFVNVSIFFIINRFFIGVAECDFSR